MPLPISTTLLIGSGYGMWLGGVGGHVTALVLFSVATANEALRAALTRSQKPSGPHAPPVRQRTPIEVPEDYDE